MCTNNYAWLANQAVQLLNDIQKRQVCISELTMLMDSIGKPGASEHAAEEILKLLNTKLNLKLNLNILDKEVGEIEKEIMEKSNRIKSNLFNLESYKKSKTAMFFVSFSSEANTHDMIKESIGRKTVIAPKVVQNEIEPSVIIDLDSLIPSGKFGILEPIEIMKIAYKNIDLVLVPGIAFDKEGHRIGYGFGYYDKFLKKVPKAVKIGLCFDFQLADKVPREEHDMQVDFIVTEERVIECRKK